MEFLARVGIDPGLIRIGWCRPRVDVAPYLGVDPEAGQQRSEQHLVGLCIGGGEKITNIMVAGRRERRLRKDLRRDAVLSEKRTMQRALHDEGAFRRFGELHDAICIRRLRCCKGQSASEADEVMRILRDVVLEPRLAQRARRELRVERHGADRLVNCGIALPGFAREETPAHGRRIPGTDEVLNDVSETWWAREL